MGYFVIKDLENDTIFHSDDPEKFREIEKDLDLPVGKHRQILINSNGDLFVDNPYDAIIQLVDCVVVEFVDDRGTVPVNVDEGAVIVKKEE